MRAEQALRESWRQPACKCAESRRAIVRIPHDTRRAGVER